MTNAHVVAGVDEPVVLVGEVEQKPATVVYYNPDIDIAVLAVDGAGGPFLRFDQSGPPNQAGAA